MPCEEEVGGACIYHGGAEAGNGVSMGYNVFVLGDRKSIEDRMLIPLAVLSAVVLCFGSWSIRLDRLGWSPFLNVVGVGDDDLVLCCNH